MRRTDREVTDAQKMKAILDRCKIVSYAMWDGEKPYAVIMNFGYEFTPEGKLRLYSHSALDGKKVSIIGGGAVGLDVVEFFAPRGAEVSIVEMMPAIGRDLDPVTKNDTKCMMEKYNVNQLTSTALQEVKEDCFVVKSPEGEVYELPFDHGFVCLGMRAQSKVYEEVSKAYKDTNVRVENIGDSVRARRIIDGTFEGRNIVFTLEQKGFL